DVVSDPFMGETSGGSQPIGPTSSHTWANNDTWIYTGEVYFPNANGDGTGTLSFAKSIDDSTLLIIDGTMYINDIVWYQPVSSGPITLSQGWHSLELRFGNGGGGAGAYPTNGWTTSYGFGFRVDSDPNDPLASSTFGGDYFIPDNANIPAAYASYFPNGLFNT